MDSAIVAAFLTGVLGPIVVLVTRYTIERRKKKTDMVQEALETSEKVLAKMEHIRDEFHADRVWVSQFHNGGHFYPTGKSIAKFSVVYEVVSAGATSIQTNFQNIPVSLFSRFINQLLENDIIEVPDFKDETIATWGLKYIAEESGTRSEYIFAVKNIEGKFIAIMGIDYTKRKTKLGMEDINHLANHATAIGGVLDTHLNKK
jgi:hypothetical protein